MSAQFGHKVVVVGVDRPNRERSGVDCKQFVLLLVVFTYSHPWGLNAGVEHTCHIGVYLHL